MGAVHDLVDSKNAGRFWNSTSANDMVVLFVTMIQRSNYCKDMKLRGRPLYVRCDE